MILREVIGSENGLLLQKYEFAKRNEAIKRLHDAGLSIREIERLTGISRGAVERLLW